MKNNSWEIEFEKKFHTTWIRSHDSMIGLNPVYAGSKCYLVDSFKVKDFITKTLQQQREEIIKEIEGIVGEDEKGEFDQYWMANQLRKEIRERLKQITNLKEK